jgi:hypothetical protein
MLRHLTPVNSNNLTGPYAPSILRFQISFPPTYPSLPPLVTFSTDIFHPLITPLTTYMYTTDIQDSGTVSATDEERLPPGGFSLRHGFPKWFGRGARRSAERARGGSTQTPAKGSQIGSAVTSPESGTGSSLSPTPGRTTAGEGRRARKPDVGIYEVLRYIRSGFDDEDVLDNVPLEAAGNPGAWHAWRTHRIKLGKIIPVTDVKEKNNWHDGLSDDGSASSTGAPEGYQRVAGGTSAPMAARRPGEWNWEGVWEVRVKKGVEASISEAVLYGNTPTDDLIRFLHMQEEEVQTIKENIRRSAESIGGDPHRRGVV